MENVPGDFFYRFFIALVICYSFEVVSKWQFKSLIKNHFSFKYDGNDDVWYIWSLHYKSVIDSCYKFWVIRTVMLAIFCGFFGYGGYDIRPEIGVLFVFLIVTWMFVELIWAKSKADKAAEAVWQTLPK